MEPMANEAPLDPLVPLELILQLLAPPVPLDPLVPLELILQLLDHKARKAIQDLVEPIR